MRRGIAPALFLITAGCSSAPPPPPTPQSSADAKVAPSPASVTVKAEVVAPEARELVEREPNDDRLSALPLPIARPTEGFLSIPSDPAQGDQDWYVVTVPGEEPAVLSATLKGPDDLDVVLEWMPKTADAKRDRAIVQADVQRKRPGDELLTNLKVSPGPVYLRVRSAWYKNKPRQGSIKPYSLMVDLLPWAETIEAEPNETPEHAVTGSMGRPNRGTLGHIKDRDTWRLPSTFREGARLTLSVSGILDLRMGVDLGWEGSKEPPLKVRADMNEGITLRNLAVPAGDSPALLVTLRALEGAAPKAAYDLQVSEEAKTEGPVEAEPNESAAAATPIHLGDTLEGHIDRKGDRDVYALRVEEAVVANLTLSPPLSSDLSLTLSDPSGAIITTRKAAKIGATESIRGAGLTPGTWGITVSGAPPNARQPYRLELSASDASGSEREPNDDPASTSLAPLTPSASSSGWIHPAGDVDCWRLERSEDTGAGIVTFQLDPPPGVPLDISVHDEAGTEVTGRKGLSAGQPGTFTHFLNPGRYTVRLRASDPKGATHAPYALRLLD